MTHVWGSPDRGPAKNLDQDIFKKTSCLDFTPQIPAHHHTAGGPQAMQADWPTHNSHVPEKSLGGTTWMWKEMFITHRFLQDKRDWKEQKMGRWWWEAAEVLEMMNRVKRARCSFQHIPLPDHHDGGYCIDQCWHLFCCPFTPAFPGMCLERSSPKILEV